LNPPSRPPHRVEVVQARRRVLDRGFERGGAAVEGGPVLAAETGVIVQRIDGGAGVAL
jgi:hypothetical protein